MRYLLIGLIKNNAMCTRGEVISIIALVANIVLLVLQLVEINCVEKSVCSKVGFKKVKKCFVALPVTDRNLLLKIMKILNI